jgi:hypothetical protein
MATHPIPDKGSFLLTKPKERSKKKRSSFNGVKIPPEDPQGMKYDLSKFPISGIWQLPYIGHKFLIWVING